MSENDEIKKALIAAREIVRTQGSAPSDIYDPRSGQWLKKDGEFTEFGIKFFEKYSPRAQAQDVPEFEK